MNEQKLNTEKTHVKVPSNTKFEKPVFFPADVTNEEQVQATLNKIKQQYGKLDVVLNCPGIGVAVRTYNINKVRIK